MVEACRQYVLFTDLVMTGLSRCDVDLEAKSRHPAIKVLHMTGYSENTLKRTGVGRADYLVISEPYIAGGLGQKMRQVIESPTE